jgi:hypothetical protein
MFTPMREQGYVDNGMKIKQVCGVAPTETARRVEKQFKLAASQIRTLVTGYRFMHRYGSYYRLAFLFRRRGPGSI